MYKLTKKERSIILYIMQGMTNGEIANALDLARNTINTYIYKLFKIYGAKNRIDLVNKVKEIAL